MFELDIRIRKQLRGTAHDLRGEKVLIGLIPLK